MYNKLFTKILDSSIWLESNVTRIVWLTLIASMNEDGFCAFASTANLAHRAIVPLQEAKEAINILESPDENSADKSNEGRRIERVPGGWIVTNAPKYQAMVTRAIVQEQTRIRVAEFRAKKKIASNANVTASNANVTASNANVKSVTPSDTDTTTDTKTKGEQPAKLPPSATSQIAESKMIRFVMDRDAERKAQFTGAALHKALHDDMRTAAFRERIPLSKAKVIFKQHLEYATLPWIDSLDSQQEIKFPDTPRPTKTVEPELSAAVKTKAMAKARQIIELRSAKKNSDNLYRELGRILGSMNVNYLEEFIAEAAKQ